MDDLTGKRHVRPLQPVQGGVEGQRQQGEAQQEGKPAPGDKVGGERGQETIQDNGKYRCPALWKDAAG